MNFGNIYMEGVLLNVHCVIEYYFCRVGIKKVACHRSVMCLQEMTPS